MEKNTIIKKLLSKLRTPLHIDYICKHILKMEKTDCLDILTELVETDVIEEENRYYQLKRKV
jgi:hypothetical protein